MDVTSLIHEVIPLLKESRKKEYNLKKPDSDTRHQQINLTSAIKCRHLLTFLAFTGLMNVYTMRMNLGVAIVAMVKTRPRESLNSSDEAFCPVLEDANTTKSTVYGGEFDWDEQTQGNILGCFFYAYIVTNFLGGRISEIFGVKWTFGLGILSTSILTMLTPVVARWHYIALIVLRVIEGLMEGVTFPALHCMMGRWYPKNERAFSYAIIHAGSTVGSVVSLLLSGILCKSTFLGGWPSAFYVFGFAGIVWVLIWFLLMHEFPETHPRISPAEVELIRNGMDEDVASKDNPIPWLAIATSVPVWVCAIASFGKNWIQNTIQINIPTYMKHILHYDIDQSGILSSVPVFVEVAMTVFAGFASDWILKKRILSIPATRKLFNTVGLLAGSVCLVVISRVGCNRNVIIALLTIATGSGGLCTVGFLVAIVDMSPVYSGSVMGIVNGIGQLSGFLAPLTVGTLTNNRQTSEQWFKIFYISAAISAFAAMLFVVLGKATLQPWSKETRKQEDTQENGSKRNVSFERKNF